MMSFLCFPLAHISSTYMSYPSIPPPKEMSRSLAPNLTISLFFRQGIVLLSHIDFYTGFAANTKGDINVVPGG